LPSGKGRGEACDATADGCRVSAFLLRQVLGRVAVAIGADGKVLALDERVRGCATRFFEKCFVDRAAGSDGAGNDILNETAA